MKWTSTAPSSTQGTIVFAEAHPADPPALARLLGGGQPSAAAAPVLAVDNAASHFKLTGVVAGRTHEGYALIAVDDQPAKPYRVGTRVNEAWVLHSVTPRSAALATRMEAPVSLTLDLPKLAQP